MYQRIFVRHLCTNKNVPFDYSRALGRTTHSKRVPVLPVNELGHRQGRALRELFAEYLEENSVAGPVAIVHSDVLRTRTTTKYVLEALGRASGVAVSRVKGDKLIRDIDQGLANDLPYDVARERFPEYARAIDEAGYLDARPPFGESHRDVARRVHEFLKKLRAYDCHVIVVSHMSPLILMRAELEGLSDERVLEMLSGERPPNGSVTRYDYDPGTGAYGLADAQRLLWLSDTASNRDEYRELLPTG